MSNLKQFFQIFHGKRSAYPVGKFFSEQLQQTYLFNIFKITNIFIDYPLKSFPLPSSPKFLLTS